MAPTSYNLDIRMYSFQEILHLFDLPDANNITQEQMKRAKMVVLKTHPDKSRLPPDFFLFYSKAFKIIVDFYNNQQRTTQEVPKTEIKYDKEADGFFENNPAVMNKVSSIPNNKFNRVFNDLFEKNQMGKQIVNRNEWFSQEEGAGGEDGGGVFSDTKESRGRTEYRNLKVSNVSEMNKTFEQIKEKQQGMVVYKGVRELPFSAGISSSNLYEEDESTEDGGDAYIETDPFSKLKFEDIKKVHKNETVFAVGEKDYDKVTKYQSVEQYNVARNMSDISLETEEENRRILEQREREFQNRMIHKQYQAKKKEIETSNKNKSVLSYFLQIEL
jgi:hypothetical protein